jgi:hypothetical protein
MANHGSYKTPALDLALNSKQGYKGGETAQRFYTKFPIYRPKGHGMPNVTDDISEVWQQHTTLHQAKNSMYNTFSTGEGLWGAVGQDDTKSTRSAYKYR